MAVFRGNAQFLRQPAGGGQGAAGHQAPIQDGIGNALVELQE
jgi:hypothetical protein